MVRMIITGSKGFSDYQMLRRECYRVSTILSDENILSSNIKTDLLNDNIEIVSGARYRAELLGEKFALSHGIPIKRIPVDYKEEAPVLDRNFKMIRYAKADNSYGVLIVFWDRKDTELKNYMIDIAKMFDLRIFVVDTTSEQDLINKILIKKDFTL